MECYRTPLLRVLCPLGECSANAHLSELVASYVVCVLPQIHLGLDDEYRKIRVLKGEEYLLEFWLIHRAGQ